MGIAPLQIFSRAATGTSGRERDRTGTCAARDSPSVPRRPGSSATDLAPSGTSLGDPRHEVFEVGHRAFFLSFFVGAGGASSADAASNTWSWSAATTSTRGAALSVTFVPAVRG